MGLLDFLFGRQNKQQTAAPLQSNNNLEPSAAPDVGPGVASAMPGRTGQPHVIGVRFDLAKPLVVNGVRRDLRELGDKDRARECCKVVLRAVRDEVLAGAQLFDGPERPGSYCVALEWPASSGRGDDLCKALENSDEYQTVAAVPNFVVGRLAGSLRLIGRADSSGKVVDDDKYSHSPIYGVERELELEQLEQARIAVDRIADQSVLDEIAKNDKNDSLRLCAVSRVVDQRLLGEIAKNDASEDVRAVAATRVTDQTLLAHIAQNDKAWRVRIGAVAHVGDQSLLGDVARNDENSSVRLAAVKHMADPNLLAHIAKNDQGEFVRSAAVERLTDQRLLADIAKSDENESVRAAAVQRLTDQRLLADSAKSDESDLVRIVAVQRLVDQTLLADIAKSGKGLRVRRAAEKRMKEV